MRGHDVVRLVRHRDVAIAYGATVVLTTVIAFSHSAAEARQAVLDSSTNLANLRAQPLRVLVASAFLLASPWSLWVIPAVLWAYGALQRWLGRLATVVVAVVGHVFATVFVAVMVAAGIAQHQLDRRVSNEPDVGVSYGLAAVVGVLVFRLPPKQRHVIATLGTVALVGVLVLSQTFTDLGHLVAWLLGLAMGFVGARTADAAAR